jgi:hypothetical protein
MPRPVVEIHQETANVVISPANPTQSTVIVGAAYHVVTKADALLDLTNVFDPFLDDAAGGVPAAEAVSIAYSNADYAPDLTVHPPVVHLTSVRTYVHSHNDCLLAENVGSVLITLQGAGASTADVIVGDVIHLYDSGADNAHVEAAVTAVLAGGVALHVSTKGNLIAVTHIRIERAALDTTLIADFQADSDSVDVGKESDVAVLVYVPGSAVINTNIICYAKVHIEWRGLRGDISGIQSLSDDAGVLTLLGKVHPYNPLAMGVDIALKNSGGKTIRALAVATDDAAGFTGALSVLNADPDVYCMVPLSSDFSGVIGPYKAAAVAQSVPLKGKFRMVVGSAEELPLYEYAIGSIASPSTGGEITAGTLSIFRDGTADFISAGVAVGDTIVNATTKVAVGLIKTLSSANTLEMEAAGVAEAGISYYIRRSISSLPDRQVAVLTATIKSASDKRLTMVYPAQCVIDEHGTQPGYYLACALGGLLASFEPHRPTNQVGIAGVVGLKSSNLTKFSDSQIDSLSDGGYYVYIQDTAAGAPYCVHQLTTGTITWPGVQEYAELSVVRNFDYVSAFFKKRMDPFIGVWNVVPQAIGSIRITLEAGISQLKNSSADRIGPVLLGGSVTSLATSSSDAGTIEGTLTVRLPKVLNKLVIRIVSN